MKKRRQAYLRERLTPCYVCDYPISQRHHMLDVAVWGDTDTAIPLCANCHELFHIIDAGMTAAQRNPKTKNRNFEAWCAVGAVWGFDHPTLVKLRDLVNESRRFRNNQQKRVASVLTMLFGGKDGDGN